MNRLDKLVQMTDIIDRLKNGVICDQPNYWDDYVPVNIKKTNALLNEAADKIEQLRNKVDSVNLKDLDLANILRRAHIHGLEIEFISGAFHFTESYTGDSGESGGHYYYYDLTRDIPGQLDTLRKVLDRHDQRIAEEARMQEIYEHACQKLTPEELDAIRYIISGDNI